MQSKPKKMYFVQVILLKPIINYRTQFIPSIWKAYILRLWYVLSGVGEQYILIIFGRGTNLNWNCIPLYELLTLNQTVYDDSSMYP